jgi:hypothetical protein
MPTTDLSGIAASAAQTSLRGSRPVYNRNVVVAA